MPDWTSGPGPRRFGSAELPARWRDLLLPQLAGAHARDPFTPRDPRGTLRRVVPVVEAAGLSAMTFRGGLAVRGAEVDHVWLAVASEHEGPWVVDLSFPLHLPAFTVLLGGYVAGEVTVDDLVAAAAQAAITDRVLGTFPDGAAYRGEPVWSLARR